MTTCDHTPLSPPNYTLTMMWFRQEPHQLKAHAIIMATPVHTKARPFILRAQWQPSPTTDTNHTLLSVTIYSPETSQGHDGHLYMSRESITHDVIQHVDPAPIPNNPDTAMDDVQRRWNLQHAAHERGLPDLVIPAIQWILRQHKPEWNTQYVFMKNNRIYTSIFELTTNSIHIDITHADTGMYFIPPFSNYAYERTKVHRHALAQNRPRWMTYRTLFHFPELEICIPPIALDTQHAIMSHQRTYHDILDIVRVVQAPAR